MTRLVLASSLVAAMAVAPSAHAIGAVVTGPPGASATVSVRVAAAVGAGRLTRWGSVEVLGSATSFAWILPARAGARVDLASDAWLEALGATATPRVVPPDVDPPCGIAGGAEVEGDFTHATTAAPDAVAVVGGRLELDSTLGDWGLSLTADVAGAVDEALSAGSALVVLRYQTGPGDVVTRTVRVVDDAAALPLGLVSATAGAVDVTAYAVGAGYASLTPGAPMQVDPGSIRWNSDGTSTYPELSDALLGGRPGAWLFETAGNGLLFAPTPVPGLAPVPSLVSTYFTRAASYGDATLAPDTCAASATAVSSSLDEVAPACAPGALARVGASACAEAVEPGELDPSVLRCGGIADDVALALSGLAPGAAWVTLARSAVAPSTLGVDTSVGAGQAVEASGPVVTCSGYATPCPAPAPTPPTTPVTGPGGASGPGGGANGGPSDDSNSGVSAAVNTGAAVAQTASEGCGGDSSDGSDSCDGDSSGDDSCSGDSSGDGGGCDGSDCRVTPRRHGGASRGLLLLVALAALARRRSGPRAGPPSADP